ncbi:hypothetical protein RND81_10G194500 [Saponaria officinalis]|uniref:Uncharacterized protein n=1 Tax=Saponaria officinalis TaxID=3572 RepID=A0AAW1I4R5_SAPOF
MLWLFCVVVLIPLRVLSMPSIKKTYEQKSEVLIFFVHLFSSLIFILQSYVVHTFHFI